MATQSRQERSDCGCEEAEEAEEAAEAREAAEAKEASGAIIIITPAIEITRDRTHAPFTSLMDHAPMEMIVGEHTFPSLTFRQAGGIMERIITTPRAKAQGGATEIRTEATTAIRGACASNGKMKAIVIEATDAGLPTKKRKMAIPT